MDNVTLVGVGGLPHKGDGNPLWDSHWLEQMETVISSLPISFDTGLDPDQGALAPDVLSHGWLERTAVKLLDQVKAEHKEGNQLVFFGEDLGGIVLKRALVIADIDPAYEGITRDTCACVFHNVLHAAPSHEAWTQALVRLVATSWRFLPKDLWKSIGSVTEPLDRLSFAFARIAPRFMVITVFRSDGEDDSTKLLRLAHEHLVPRLSSQVVRFPDSESDTVSEIFGLLRRATTVPSESRHYLRNLSSLAWHAQVVASRSLSKEADILANDMDRVTGLLNGEANIVALHGPRGTGKLSFLTLTYQQLVSHRQPMESSAVFVLDEWDHRSEPVSAILRSIILQLLSCEPELVRLVQPPVLDDTKDTMARQTEGNLWIQLRLIVRITKCKRMTIAINSIDSCAGKDYRGFLKALFDLQLMASSRLKILCTTETDAMNLVDSNALGMVSLNVQDLPGLKTAKAAFQTRLAHNLVSMSRFEAIKDEVAACLAKSESFLHASLIAHRIRLVESLSSPVHVRRELDGLGTNLEKTVLGIVATCPPWVRTAVAWILFAQRPLKTEELAVAVALHSWPVVWTATSLVVADFIPRDMAGDVKRRLGPLVVARNGCVRLAHGSISAILQNWLKKSKDQEAVQNASLTQQLVAYLRNCLDQIPVGETWRELRGPRFGLLCYAFHHWHEHYSSAMGRIVPPLAPSSALVQVHDIAFTLFTNNNYRRHLWSSHQNATGHNIEESAPPGLESPVLLAARFGLLDIVVRLMNESDSPRPTGDTNKPEDPEERTVSDSSGKNGSSEVVDVFHVACLFGFRAMAEHFLDRIVDTTVLARELALACLRGNETIFQTTMTHYRHVLGCKDLPPELLLNACLAGHASLAETLLSWGANPNVPADRPPLHQAVDRGHLEVVNVLLKYKADVMAAFPDKSTPLHHSIDHGHRDISLRLLQEPGIQDTPDKQGVTALHLAAEKGDVCIIQHLLDLERPITSEARHMEGNTESTDEESSTTPSDSPLHRAAAHGHLEAVKVLLERGYHVDEPDSEGRSVLYSALCHGHRDVADHFLRYLSDRRDKVKITFGNTYAESELKQAIRQGNVTAVKQLLRLGANPNGSDESDSSPLADAVKADHSVIVSILLEHSASMTQTVDFGRNEAILGETIWDGWLPHHFAAYYGSVNVMEALNAALPSGLVGARTRSGHTPLHLAVFREHSQIVENMLAKHKGVTAGTGDPAGLDDPGSWVLERKDSWRRSALDARGVLRSGLESGLSSILDIDSHTEEGITALHIAAAGGNVHLAKQLVASGALPELANKSGKRAIHYAAGAEKNADSMVQLLLQAGAEVQPRDSEGMTPLHVAASGSDESHRIAVLLLLREGADPNKVSHDGLSPLVLAASAGSVAVVRYLVQYGADVNVRVNNDGYTALHAAVSSGKTESIRILAEAGAELDVADDTGDTPLHEAARSGNIDAATILIQFGAPLNATNTRRMTALHRVVLNAFIKMAELLLDSGADPNIPDEDGDTTLTAATVAEEPAMVNLLLIPKYKTKVDVMNSAGQTPLMLALRSPGQLLPPLLSAKADVQQCGDDKVTVLHMAAAQDSWNVDSLRPLFNYGKSHLDAKDREGLAPIHHAARHGRSAMIEALRDAGANMAATDKQGRTTMHFAVRTMWASQIEDVFGKFLRPGAEHKVNIPDNDGWTPLHWACMINDANLINLLLNLCETDTSRRDLILQEQKHRWTALAIAEFCGTDENREALLAALERLRAAGVEGIPTDLPAVKRAKTHDNHWCDDCRIVPIHGLRFKCDIDDDFDFCFKCYWHHEDTHFPKGHTFTPHGEGPIQEPRYVSLTEQETLSAVSTASVASSELVGSIPPPPPPPPIVIPEPSADDDEFPQWLRVTSSSRRRRERRRPSTLEPVNTGLGVSGPDNNDAPTPR